MSSRKTLSTGGLAILIALLVVVADQAVKIWVKTNFYLGEEVEIFPWFRLDFVENNGMAFGWHLGSKFLLTLFRILFVGFLVYCIIKLRDVRLKRGFVICVALILAGAVGNIIDCLFYGIIFNDPYPPQVATLFPPGGGYAPLFHGRVVDMLYFPLFSFYWPDWIPMVGGERFDFFKPVFNIADSAISVGIVCVIFFYSKELNKACQAVKALKDKHKETL